MFFFLFLRYAIHIETVAIKSPVCHAPLKSPLKEQQRISPVFPDCGAVFSEKASPFPEKLFEKLLPASVPVYSGHRRIASYPLGEPNCPNLLLPEHFRPVTGLPAYQNVCYGFCTVAAAGAVFVVFPASFVFPQPVRLTMHNVPATTRTAAVFSALRTRSFFIVIVPFDYNTGSSAPDAFIIKGIS